ncbi:MAG: exo-alpha-sialidase [Planctomycetota bacterium]
MSDRLLVGTRKGLFILKRRARGNWSLDLPLFAGNPVSMTCHDPRDGGLLAAVVLGHFGSKFHRSDDGGKTWTEVGVPAYPPVPEGTPLEQDPFGRVIPRTLHDVWEMVPGGPDQPGRIWCGTIPGGVFRSDDGGRTWSLVEALWNDPLRKQWMGGGADAPGVHSISVDPRDSRRLTIAVSSGGIWHTTDDGASWKNDCAGMRNDYLPPEQAYDPNSQDPHRLVRCKGAPDRMWVQHHNGIFRSDDAGRNWIELEKAGPSVFGFPVVVHPQQPDTAWFVPATKDQYRYPVDAAMSVTRTRDGGKTFDVLTSGLPKPPCYDLVYRHALDLAADGERLAFGSTTGGLWISEDGGDHWHEVSAHLPPIRCVRFG